MSQFHNPICFQGNAHRSSITSPGTNRYRKRERLTAYTPQEVRLRKTDRLKVKTTCESISDIANRSRNTHARAHTHTPQTHTTHTHTHTTHKYTYHTHTTNTYTPHTRTPHTHHKHIHITYTHTTHTHIHTTHAHH